MNDTSRLVREGIESLRVRNFTRHAAAIGQTAADNARLRGALNRIVADIRLDWRENPEPDTDRLIESIEKIAKEALSCS